MWRLHLDQQKPAKLHKVSEIWDIGHVPISLDCDFKDKEKIHSVLHGMCL